MSVWFGALDVLPAMPFDAYYGKNDDGRGFLRRVYAAEAHDAPLIGEFDNGAHPGAPALPAACGSRTPFIRR